MSLECKFRVSKYGGGLHNLSRFFICKRSLRQRTGKLRTSALFHEEEVEVMKGKK